MIFKSVFAAFLALLLIGGLLIIRQKFDPVVASAEGMVVPYSTPSPVVAPTNRRTSMFLENLPLKFEIPTDETGNLLLHEYGSVFIARNGAIPPSKVIFVDDKDVKSFQTSVVTSSRNVGGPRIQLQKAAMDALGDAMAEATAAGLSISARGVDSGARDYEQTVRLWKSRVEPGFRYWVAKGRVSKAEADRIQKLSAFEQVPEILNLEKSGIWFAKSLDKSIIYSVAPPGTSQHLAMLALDVAEFDDPRVRSILADHGWFQTVVSDLPHFTYIGVEESKLSAVGLRSETNAGRVFWVPDF